MLIESLEVSKEDQSTKERRGVERDLVPVTKEGEGWKKNAAKGLDPGAPCDKKDKPLQSLVNSSAGAI